jgi:hypothetical protein
VNLSAHRAMGLQIQILNASTSREIDAAFAVFGRERPDAVFVGQDAFYNGRRLQLANWASRYALPMTSGSRDICEVGGLMSYGSNIVDTYRQEGVYTGRILLRCPLWRRSWSISGRNSDVADRANDPQEISGWRHERCGPLSRVRAIVSRSMIGTGKDFVCPQ